MKYRLVLSPLERVRLWHRVEQALARRLPPLPGAAGSPGKAPAAGGGHTQSQPPVSGTGVLDNAMSMAHRAVAPNATLALAMDLAFRGMRHQAHGSLDAATASRP